VKPGDLIATIVPRDEVRIVAQFPPALAVGRIVPGQSARIRLDGFSWVEFGMLEATVTQAANEPLAGGIRVEMRINAGDASRIPVQHGLTGSVDVRIGQASPWTLLRRSLGDVFLTEAPPPIAEPPAPARSVGS
jgi:membrane fusion protein (multidrug efflux system)